MIPTQKTPIPNELHVKRIQFDEYDITACRYYKLKTTFKLRIIHVCMKGVSMSNIQSALKRSIVWCAIRPRSIPAGLYLFNVEESDEKNASKRPHIIGLPKWIFWMRHWFQSKLKIAALFTLQSLR